MALELTQPPTTLKIEYLKIILVGKALPSRKANSLTDICEPIVWKMWVSQG
jgi:hypothetical protein